MTEPKSQGYSPTFAQQFGKPVKKFDPNVICPKCGSEWLTMTYNKGSNMLDVTCPKCGATFEMMPRDRAQG